VNRELLGALRHREFKTKFYSFSMIFRVIKSILVLDTSIIVSSKLMDLNFDLFGISPLDLQQDTLGLVFFTFRKFNL
jgi:hypothetical protein